MSPAVKEIIAKLELRNDNLSKKARNEIIRLDELINNAHITDFLEAVRLESAHQIERWGESDRQNKMPEDWFWLVGYLAGKALRANIEGDADKAKHHTISSAAALYNWHRFIAGADELLRDLEAGQKLNREKPEIRTMYVKTKMPYWVDPWTLNIDIKGGPQAGDFLVQYNRYFSQGRVYRDGLWIPAVPVDIIRDEEQT